VWSKKDTVGGQQYDLNDISLFFSSPLLFLTSACTPTGNRELKEAIREGVDTIEHASLGLSSLPPSPSFSGSPWDIYDDDYILPKREETAR